MILTYMDIFEGGKLKNIKASITTDHPASSYNQPVILLGDGGPLDAESWILMRYNIKKISKKEIPMMGIWVKNVKLMMGGTK